MVMFSYNGRSHAVRALVDHVPVNYVRDKWTVAHWAQVDYCLVKFCRLPINYIFFWTFVPGQSQKFYAAYPFGRCCPVFAPIVLLDTFWLLAGNLVRPDNTV
ncbi:MAG: ankyrin repeat domain-containing protein [Methanoregula sp.]|nr:ankyrin repeat domain-containing protein [Methanoregula sp.]